MYYESVYHRQIRKGIILLHMRCGKFFIIISQFEHIPYHLSFLGGSAFRYAEEITDIFSRGVRFKTFIKEKVDALHQKITYLLEDARENSASIEYDYKNSKDIVKILVEVEEEIQDIEEALNGHKNGHKRRNENPG